MTYKRHFLVDNILSHRRIHLLGGISSAGKTRFILPAMVKWAKGENFLGFPSHPVPWAYVSGDRKLDEALETIDDLKMNPNDVPIIPAFGADDKNVEGILNEASKKGYQLLVWEGFGDFCPPPSHKHQVRSFLSSLSSTCDRFTNGLTILGIMESPKLKPHEMYKSPRQLISGVSSWGYHTSTVMMILHEDPDDETNSRRVLRADIKGYPRFKCEGDYDYNGHVVFMPPCTDPERANTSDSVESVVMLTAFLDTIKPGAVFNRVEIDLALPGLTKRTIERGLDSLITSGIVERVRKGVYKKVTATQPLERV